MIVVVIFVIVAVVIYFYSKVKKEGVYINSDNVETVESQIKINFTSDLTMDINTCINKANQNDITALFELGYRHYYGIDVSKDIDKAVYYTRRSAELDDSDRSNGKLFYFALYYNLGENYGINMRFAEKCLLSVAKENYDAKYYVGKIIRDNVMDNKPTTLTEEGDLAVWSVFALTFLTDCFIASRLPEPKTTYGDEARKLIKDFEMFLFACIINLKDENGNPVGEEEANRRIYKIISHAMDKADNKDDLMRELGY